MLLAPAVVVVPVVALLLSRGGRSLALGLAAFLLVWLNAWWVLPFVDVHFPDSLRFVVLHLPQMWWVSLPAYLMAFVAVLAGTGFLAPRRGTASYSAAMAARRGDYLAAGELLLHANHPRRALHLFLRGRAWARAGEVARGLGRTRRAASLLEKAGGTSVAAAAQLYARLGDDQKAAALWLRHAQQMVSTGQPEQAIEPFLRGDDPRRACHAAELAMESHRLGEATADVALRAARQAKLPELGAQIALACERFREAGDLLLAAGQPAAAAHAFQRAGDAMRAAEALRLAGMTTEAARLRAQHLEDTGQMEAAVREYADTGLEREAAAALERSGRWQEAVERYRAIGMTEEAARLALRQGASARAAELFAGIERWEEAGDAWEAAKSFTEAASCYEKAGDLERAQGMLAAAGMTAQRAVVLARLGRFEEGFTILVRGGHPAEAHELLSRFGGTFPHLVAELERLGGWLEERGDTTGAIGVLQRATAGAPVTRAILPALYRQAVLLDRRGDLRNAEAILQRIVDFDYSFMDAAARLQDVAARRAAASSGEHITPPPEIERPASGDRYMLLEELGRGGMGVVYRATDTRLRRTVAIKVLNPRQLTPEALERFQREARAAASLSHPGIVHIYDFDEGFGSTYISMEYVEGPTLNQILREDPDLLRGHLLPIMRQIAAAVAYAHARGVVHRDLKPANMMLAENRQVKILDFGIARRLDDVEPDASGATGTPYYMAPEQILGEKPDQRSDIYSLGVTFFQMATATLPFTSGNVLRAHLEQPPPDPLTLQPSLDPAIARLILRCMAKDPRERPASGAALQSDLDDIETGFGA